MSIIGKEELEEVLKRRSRDLSSQPQEVACLLYKNIDKYLEHLMQLAFINRNIGKSNRKNQYWRRL